METNINRIRPLHDRVLVKRQEIAAKLAGGVAVIKVGAATEAYGDLIEMGILDPAKLTRSALQNAASIASLILTTDAMIAELPKDEENPEAMGEMGM